MCQSHQSLNESLNSAPVVQFGYENSVSLGKNDAVEYIKSGNWVTVNFLWQEEMKKGTARKEKRTERFLAVEGCELICNVKLKSKRQEGLPGAWREPLSSQG